MLTLLQCVCHLLSPCLALPRRASCVSCPACMLQYLQLCAEGPTPQALQDTLSKLIQHLSSPC